MKEDEQMSDETERERELREEAERLLLDPREAAYNAWDGEREVPVV